jgi:hypothetical protein
MGETVDYFRRERYITRRLSVIVPVGSVFLVLSSLAVVHGHMTAEKLWWAIGGVVVCVITAVVLVLRAADAKFPRSAITDHLPLDEFTRRKLRRRIRFLQGFVVIYAFILLSSIYHAHRGQWPGVLAAAVIILLMEYALVKAIRRLKSKLNENALPGPQQ